MRDKWALLMAKKATRRRGGSDIEENEWNGIKPFPLHSHRLTTSKDSLPAMEERERRKLRRLMPSELVKACFSC